MLIVATELQVRNFWLFLPFVRLSVMSMTQVKKADGCLHASANNAGWRTGFTLTAWASREAMLQFRNSGAHKKAMQQTGRLSRRYKTVIWEADKLPGWKEAKEKLSATPFTELKR